MRKLLALTAAIAVAACATSSATPGAASSGTSGGALIPPPATQAPPGTVSASSPAGSQATWHATLMSMNGSNVTGSADVTPTGASGETSTAKVAIEGAGSGMVHPWHVHSGTCATGGGVVGPASVYSPLVAGADGKASGTAAIPGLLNPAQSYHVNIHMSPSDMGTIIACGDLTMAKT